MARIVFCTLGSLGDLHPYMAVARELAARGHAPVIATHPYYRARVEGVGVGFAPVRPDMSEYGDPAEVMRKAMDLRHGSRWILEHVVLAKLTESRDDLMAACAGADLVVSHVLTLTAPLVAEKLGVPRVHSVLQPMTMYSCTDPPLMPGMPLHDQALRWGPGVWRALYAVLRAAGTPWFAPFERMRREMGLPRAAAHPMLGLSHGVPTLAMFSRVLAAPQPDWPARTTLTGFCVHDRDGAGGGMSGELRAFLDAGEPPVVFTLGSAGVFDAREFWDVAARVSRTLGVRAVLLTGTDGPAERPDLNDGARVLAVPYAPHSELFPRAAVTVHCGGVGTTGQALASGRPMLIMPYSHDQPDNARRCARLGVARVVRRDLWRDAIVTRELGALLADREAAARAGAVAAEVRAERGAAAAADALEDALRG
ncbi:MAG: glycosyltransferase family 1 protein [Candidatus Eisenbacteria bacterium]|uniref:Glycosyltransferase family 1 protein n=1 Tax=Eiseniibacteriota bacterium TaxID=2212470 RepID=A0A933W1P8_UNCEI|nr:glycosyltransferase family 1 protein [Candidatus Eisenbacteria bacterium]